MKKLIFLVLALAITASAQQSNMRSVRRLDAQMKSWCVSQHWLGHTELDGSITYIFIGAWSDNQKQRFVARCDGYIRSVEDKFIPFASGTPSGVAVATVATVGISPSTTTTSGALAASPLLSSSAPLATTGFGPDAKDIPLCEPWNDGLRFQSLGEVWQVNFHPAIYSSPTCGIQYVGHSQWGDLIGGAKGAGVKWRQR